MLLLLIVVPILVGYVQGIPIITTSEARVSEDVHIGAFAFQVNATDTLAAELTYKFVTEGENGVSASYFKIDGKTGRVVLAKLLDREDKAVIRVLVEVSSSETVRAPILVFVEDANDNKPVFQHGPLSKDVPENTPVGSSLFRVHAIDKDFNTAAVVTYSISNAIPAEGLSLFNISSSGGEVTLAGRLNFTGKSSFYQLEINATDGGGPFEGETVFLWETIGAFIKVVDVPDLDPQFLQLPYSGFVKENTAIGTSVFQVEAFDPDREVNDIIFYSISGSNAPDLFKVDQRSGQIFVNSTLDRESLLNIDATVKLQVVATEANLNVNGIHASSNAEVEIIVLDINDNKPLFYACNADPCDFTTEANNFSGSVEEQSSRGVIVAGLNMAVRDLDDFQSGNAVTNLRLEGPDKNAFSVMLPPMSSFVQISINRPLDVDYETKKTMIVQVIASDPSLQGDCCSTATVTIQINDTNDNSPTFQNETYSLEVEEHSDVGTIIATITASDPDTEDVGKLTYSLASGSILKYFAVDQNNGSVMVNSKDLDRETRSSYTATLQATDSVGAMGFTTLEITILDINDNKPEIMREIYEEFVKEGPGEKLEIEIQARDDDEKGTNNSKLHYKIMKSKFSKNFTIDENKGILRNVGPLDREAIDPSADGVIELTVVVYDLGVPSLSSNVTVLIDVENINDNTPVFRNHSYTFYVKESVKGAFVGSVFASDADQVNNRISFDITDGGLASFIVVPIEEEEGRGYMGNISVDQDIELDYEKRKEPYIFKVVASDIDRKKDVASVEVHVLDVNDERPELPPVQTLWVKEDTNETVVGIVKGEDKDSNHSLIYELLSSECRCKGVIGPCKQDWFNLLPTGEVTVNSEFVIDYEACDQVIMELQVVDIFTEKGENNSIPGLLQINIEDVNDNVPQFIISEALFIVVNEKTERGTSVAVVTATDRDSGKNKEVTFSILNAEFVSADEKLLREALFYVDSVVKEDEYVGTIKTLVTLPSERKGKYLVTVEAANSGVEPQLKNSTQLEVYTIDSSYRVELYFEPSVDQINENINEIRRTLSDATKATVHILRTVAVSATEQRATPLTLLEAYFVYLNGSAIQSETVEKILQEDLYHANILRKLGLAGIVSGGTDPGEIDPVRFVLLGLVAGLLIVLVVMITSLVCTQRNYKRKLKAAKALNSAAMVATENQKPSAIVPGTNQMKANPVLNLNIDTTTDLGFEEEDSSTDRVSVNSLDYNIDIDMTEKDTAPMMVIEEENEEMENDVHTEPLDFALATRGDKRKAPAAPHGFANPILDTTDL